MLLIVVLLLVAGVLAELSYVRRVRNVSCSLAQSVGDCDGDPSRGVSVVVSRVESVEYICQLLSSSVNLYEVIVVDNFEHREQLFSDIIHHFGLIRVNYVASGEIPYSAVEALYRSHRRIYSRLVVVCRSRECRVACSQIAASVSSFDFVLELPRLRLLRRGALLRLLFEISRFPPSELDQIKSLVGERFLLLRREIVVARAFKVCRIVKANRRVIMYRVLKKWR